MDSQQHRRQIAQATRQACIAAALAAYEEAGMLGLCAEGRWEAAVSAMQSLALDDTPAEPHGGEQGAD